MRLFVDKNLSGRTSPLSRAIITLGFALRNLKRSLVPILGRLASPAVDLIFLNVLIFFGRWIRFAQPAYDLSVWLVNGLYSLFFIVAGFFFGIYTSKRFSGRFALYSAMVGGVLSSAFTYFFQQWAFSKFVVLWFSCGMMLALPAWRILVRRWVGRRPSSARRIWLRRKALIVGTDGLAQSLGRQIAEDPSSELEPVGYLAFSEDGVGNVIGGVPVLGSVEELDQIILTEHMQEVLFSTAEASYERIIGLIQNLSNRSLNFRIIPREHPAGDVQLPLLRLELSAMPRSAKAPASVAAGHLRNRQTHGRVFRPRFRKTDP